MPQLFFYIKNQTLKCFNLLFYFLLIKNVLYFIKIKKLFSINISENNLLMFWENYSLSNTILYNLNIIILWYELSQP